MESADLSLSTPRDFLRYRAVLLSAPTDIRQYERAVQPASAFQPRQCLCGYDAQLQLFAAALRSVGLEPWFLPAPDVYATAYSFAHLTEVLGQEVTEPGMILHVCFGMPWAARVLRGVTNLAVLAGVARESPLQLRGHPFGSGHHLAAAMAGVLAYYPLQRTVSTTDGRVLPACILDRAFTEPEAPEVISAAVLDPASGAEFRSGFRIQSVLEFTVAAWQERSADAATPSLDFRRATLRSNAALPGQDRRLTFVLVPWNMANARSMAPNIAERLSSDTERGPYECGIVLLPFNEDHTSALQLQAVAEACRERAVAGCAETIFLMRITSMRSIPALRAMFTCCWLDGSDPEWQWNASRLSQIGFKNLLIADSGREASVEPSPLPQHIDAVFPAEEARVIHSRDGFGERVWQGRALSLRGMRRLLQYAEQDRPSKTERRSLGTVGTDVKPLGDDA